MTNDKLMTDAPSFKMLIISYYHDAMISRIPVLNNSDFDEYMIGLACMQPCKTSSTRRGTLLVSMLSNVPSVKYQINHYLQEQAAYIVAAYSEKCDNLLCSWINLIDVTMNAY